MENKPWYINADKQYFGFTTNPIDEELAYPSMLANALQTGREFRRGHASGTPTLTPLSFREGLVALGGTPAYTVVAPPGGRDETLYAWPDAVLYASAGMMQYAALDPVLFDKIKAFADTCFTALAPPERLPRGMVYTFMVQRDGTYGIMPIGLVASPIERDNYAPDVLAQYDHAVADLQAPSPCGRVVVFNGCPGTGKTYLVRSMIDEAKACMHVLVSPQLVSDLNGPEFVQTLMSEHRSHPDGTPIVLIVEDADACIAERQASNMNSIATLLNLGDGILGKLLDIRIVVTTNAEKASIDPAMLRAGRLCQHLNVGHLSAEQTNAVYERIAGARAVPVQQRPWTHGNVAPTLAEIYLYARTNEPHHSIHNRITTHAVTAGGN